MIEIKDLNKIYNKKKSNKFHALYDVSLTIDDGGYILDGVNVADMEQKDWHS